MVPKCRFIELSSYNSSWCKLHYIAQTVHNLSWYKFNLTTHLSDNSFDTRMYRKSTPQTTQLIHDWIWEPSYCNLSSYFSFSTRVYPLYPKCHNSYMRKLPKIRARYNREKHFYDLKYTPNATCITKSSGTPNLNFQCKVLWRNKCIAT